MHLADSVKNEDINNKLNSSQFENELFQDTKRTIFKTLNLKTNKKGVHIGRLFYFNYTRMFMHSSKSKTHHC